MDEIYYIDVEYTGSIVYVDKRNKSRWQIPRDLIKHIKEGKDVK